MRAEEKARCRESVAREIKDWEPEARPDDPWWLLIRRTLDWFDCSVSLVSDAFLTDKGLPCGSVSSARKLEKLLEMDLAFR